VVLVLEGQEGVQQEAGQEVPAGPEAVPLVPLRAPAKEANQGGVVQQEPRLQRPCVVDDPW
jgi:hypothetical protein